MKNLSLSLDKELEVMSKWGISADELMFIRLLYIALDPNCGPRMLIKYVNECSKKGVARTLLINLQEKNILDKKYKIPLEGEGFNLSEILFNQSFEKKYFKISGEAGLELWEMYPSYMYMDNGKMLPLKNITKSGFYTDTDFYVAYCKAIKYDKDLHENVIKSLVFAKENNLITYGICEYVISRKWEDHFKMMSEDQIGKFSVKFDTIETV